MTADPGTTAIPTILEPEFAPLAAALLHDYYRATRSDGLPRYATTASRRTL
jgi:hypothetical protein